MFLPFPSKKRKNLIFVELLEEMYLKSDFVCAIMIASIPFVLENGPKYVIFGVNNLISDYFGL